MMMGQDNKRMNVEVDRLSSLPDDLIHKILALNGLKPAIGTSVFSSRWRYIWTSMPCLDFSTEDFSTLTKFSEYVTNVLSRRDSQVEVYSINFSFRGDVNEEFVKQIMNYAFSHNIQQLNITCLLENDVELPLSLFRSHSLKHLSLKRGFLRVCSREGFENWSYGLTTMSTLELPALTTLYISDVIMCCDDINDKSIGIFSKCPNLNNLTLKNCRMKELNILSINNPLLSNLTLESVHGTSLGFVKVVAPQLKNLNIKPSFSGHPHRISAPNLASFIYTGYSPLLLSTEGFQSLEKVDLCVSNGRCSDAPRIVRMFQQLKSVKHLTLNLEILELLSSSVDVILHQPSPFSNLKNVKVYPANELSVHEDKKIGNIATEVKSYLLDNSPRASFTMISREEVRTKKNVKLAQEHMESLRVRLEREKAETETKITRIEQRKTPMGSHITKMDEQWDAHYEYLDHIDETMTCINRFLEDLSKQIEEGNAKIVDIISDLHEVKEAMAKLPASNRAELQPCFSSLCSEADIVVNKIMDHKTLCDMKGSRFSVYIHGLATTSTPSF